MKKVLFIALFLLGISNASIFGMVLEIILSEMYTIMPLDDPGNETIGEGPDPNQIRATIDNTRLHVNTSTAYPLYVEVIDQETGEVVVEEEFVDEIEATIDQAGSYTIQIYSGNTIMTGEFEVK